MKFSSLLESHNAAQSSSLQSWALKRGDVSTKGQGTSICPSSPASNTQGPPISKPPRMERSRRRCHNFPFLSTIFVTGAFGVVELLQRNLAETQRGGPKRERNGASIISRDKHWWKWYSDEMRGCWKEAVGLVAVVLKHSFCHLNSAS